MTQYLGDSTFWVYCNDNDLGICLLRDLKLALPMYTPSYGTEDWNHNSGVHFNKCDQIGEFRPTGRLFTLCSFLYYKSSKHF
jgi:hypothetical protein